MLSLRSAIVLSHHTVNISCLSALKFSCSDLLRSTCHAVLLVFLFNNCRIKAAMSVKCLHVASHWRRYRWIRQNYSNRYIYLVKKSLVLKVDSSSLAIEDTDDKQWRIITDQWLRSSVIVVSHLSVTTALTDSRWYRATNDTRATTQAESPFNKRHPWTDCWTLTLTSDVIDDLVIFAEVHGRRTSTDCKRPSID